MTLRLVDVASWQGGLQTEDVVRAGYGAVNLKISHGLGAKSVHPDLAGWATRAKAAGLGISTFHYLDGSAPGTDQARYAHSRLQFLGLAEGTAHQVDCESAATLAILRDYLTTMQGLLGRPVAVYTGDWWWQPRGWNVTDLTPYLWAAPNTGYQPDYPGDTSPHWTAGYGSWPDLAVMQYAVGPLDGTTGSINVSKSAIRDPQVWAALTGGQGMAWIVVASLEALRAEFNRVFPNRDRTSDGGIGDQAHATGSSGHNPDETGVPEDYDADSIDEVRARDFDADLRHPTVSMERVCQYLVGECRAGRVTWIKYIIFNRRIWRASASPSWKQETYTGPSPHTEHLHVSCKPDTASENNTRPVGLASLVEVDVDQAEKLKATTGNPSRTVADLFGDLSNMRDWLVLKSPTGIPTPPEAGSPLANLLNAARQIPALTDGLVALTAGQTALATNLAALPGAVAAELEDEGGVDGAVVQAAVERALAKLRLTVNPDA